MGINSGFKGLKQNNNMLCVQHNYTYARTFSVKGYVGLRISSSGYITA